MNENQQKIIQALRWVLYPIALIMTVAFAWDFFAGAEGKLFQSASGFLDQVSDPLFLLVTLLFWFVFAALAFEFLRRELAGVQTRARMGRVELSMRRPFVMGLLVPPVAVLGLVVLMNMIVFRPELVAFDAGDTSIDAQALFWLFYGTGHFLLVVFLLRALRNKPFFVLTDRGFLYEPGDLSTGLVLWCDVAGLREVDLLQGNTTVQGPRLGRTLVVSLKNADSYNRHYNPLLRLLVAQSMKIVRYQAEGDGDMVVAAEDFGARYAEVREMIARRVAAAGGQVTLL